MIVISIHPEYIMIMAQSLLLHLASGLSQHTIGT